MARYVKFLRGTPEAYANLAQKDSDTLYFIYEQDESNALLYLGSKLIAGSNDDEENLPTISNLSDLRDVLLENFIERDSLLVYDTQAAAWVNKDLEELLFIGATKDSPGLAGFVPAPEVGQLDLFLRSDGTWAKLSVDHTILTLQNTNHSNHNDLIYEATINMENIDGNIIIIKDLIADDKWQYTSYIFDNNIWKAMNGNYNAENIYFDEDLITTTEVGNISLTNGQAVIAAAGKNLKQIFETIFVKEKNPKVTQPSVDLIFENAKSYEVGTEVEPKYTATFNNGQYEFGPDTGVKVSTWTISDNNNNILTTNNGSFNKFVVTDDTNYSITATANYTSGQMPVTNLGNNCPEAQIFENSASATKNGLVGYRKTFYGTFDNKDELTSEKIRSLNSTKNSLINGDSIEVSIPVGACRVIFAYPSDLNELDSITDTNGFGAEILSGFTKINLDVEGNNGFLAKPYNIYYIDYARANNTINSYTFTIKEEG